MTVAAPVSNPVSTSAGRKPPGTRIVSIDALRGLVMFLMIFANDIGEVSHQVVPGWLRHYPGPDGMTFVDLVFPAFLFIAGMSVPFALGARLKRGGSIPQVLGHVVTRTLALLFIGVLMVNEAPDRIEMGWSPDLWRVLMFVSAMLAFCSISPRVPGGLNIRWTVVTLIVRVSGWAGLIVLAVLFRGEDGRRIIQFSPFSIETSWWGILGLIGWAYFVASAAFLMFRQNRTALLGLAILLFCLYPADRADLFRGFWLTRILSIGEVLGSLGGIAVLGLLLSTVLTAADRETTAARLKFTLLFIVGCGIAAWLARGLYGIHKDSTTPSWALWACAAAAASWLILHLAFDRARGGPMAKPLAVAGQNVLLAYLISELLPSFLNLTGLSGWYENLAEPGLAAAMARSAGIAALILICATLVNRAGIRLRL